MKKILIKLLIILFFIVALCVLPFVPYWLNELILWLVNLEKLANVIAFYSQYGDKLYLFMFLVVLVYLVVNAVNATSKKRANKDQIILKERRKLYAVFSLSIIIGLICGYVEWHDWKLLLPHVLLAVFIDLSIYQTPLITKLGGAEFKEHKKELTEVVDLLSNSYNEVVGKRVEFSRVLDNAQYHGGTITLTSSMDQIRVDLEAYLKDYTDTFRYTMALHNYVNGPHSASQFLVDIQRLYSLNDESYRDEEGNEIDLLTLASTLASVSYTVLIARKVIVVPLQVNSFICLVYMQSTVGNKVDEHDAHNIIDLTKIYCLKYGLS